MSSSRRFASHLAVVVALALVAAACGDDDEDATTVPAGDAETTEEPAEEPSGSEDGGGEPAVGGGGCAEPDDAVDEDHGEGAGAFRANVECAGSEPLAADGDPVVIGFQHPEGDPAGSFPEYRLAAEAATRYINEELGGLGSDPLNGVTGRPIELDVCQMAINPADSQRCANELAAEDPWAVVSALNFFGNHFPVYEAADVPVIVGTPLTVADFTGDAFAIGGGGGCLGVHTGLIEFATTEFEGVQKIAVPWADTPPGQVCYYDLERKPLDVLRGEVEGESDRAGSLPDLEHIGVPIVPATPDVTPQVSEVLGFDPDVIIFSAQGADCWNFVDGLGRLGWSAEETPLVLSSACIDFEAMEAAGDLAEGIYFVGSAGYLTNDPATIDDERNRFEAELYQEKSTEYGLADDQRFKGFAIAGWNAMMSIWNMSSELTREGEELTPEGLAAAYAATEDRHMFGSTPISCATAPEPYTAVCNSMVVANVWDGDSLESVGEPFTGIGLVAGTEIMTSP